MTKEEKEKLWWKYYDEAVEKDMFMPAAYAEAKVFCDTMPQEAWDELNNAKLVDTNEGKKK